MNNYSWLQKKLHQFALSSQFMRETFYDFETLFFQPKQNQDDHVFIVGLARSGSTILLNAVYHSGLFASLSYADMPFILSPNLWSKIRKKQTHTNYVERAHRDGIKISSKSPEAFEEVFWKTFKDCDDRSIENFKNYIDLITLKYQKERYLSKNNQNIKRLDIISKIYKNSKILIPFRDPIQHAYSMLTQHKKFIEDSKKDKFISNYMFWIGHTEFGPNYIPIKNKNLIFKDDMKIDHWIEQWFKAYEECLKKYRLQKNVHFICYEKICNSQEYWNEILRFLEIKDEYKFKFIESKKDISFKQNELSKKCYEIYDELCQDAF